MLAKDEWEARRSLLVLLESANPMWPMFLGHPQTGVPVELSKEAFERIKAALRESVNA